MAADTLPTIISYYILYYILLSSYIMYPNINIKIQFRNTLKYPFIIPIYSWHRIITINVYCILIIQNTIEFIFK